MTLDHNSPLIYLITAGDALPDDPDKNERVLDLIRAAVEVSIPLIQIREKRLTARELFELTSKIVDITRGSRTKVLVNDRVDIAAAAGADGVHLTSVSIPVHAVRAKYGPDMLIGVSTHSIPEIIDAAQQGADLAVFGPVFRTPGKCEPVGIEALKTACIAANGFPVIGLGGVDRSNYQEVLSSGASGFAAIRWLNDADELRSVATEISEKGKS